MPSQNDLKKEELTTSTELTPSEPIRVDKSKEVKIEAPPITPPTDIKPVIPEQPAAVEAESEKPKEKPIEPPPAAAVPQTTVVAATAIPAAAVAAASAERSPASEPEKVEKDKSPPASLPSSNAASPDNNKEIKAPTASAEASNLNQSVPQPEIVPQALKDIPSAGPPSLPPSPGQSTGAAVPPNQIPPSPGTKMV